MSGIFDYGVATMSAAERQLEVIARNVANISTPDFQRAYPFEVLVQRARSAFPVPEVREFVQPLDSTLQFTGRPTDIVASNGNFFLIRSGEAFALARGASLHRDDEGRLIDQSGRILQQEGGGDIVTDDSEITFAPDGTVLGDGQPIARVAFVRPVEVDGDRRYGGSTAEDVVPVGDGQLRSGMLPSASVDLSAEMTALTLAARRAETGARLVQIHDELLSRAISNLSEAPR